MLKGFGSLVLVVGFAFLLSGCAVPLPSAGPGYVVTKTQEPVAMGSSEKENKTGKACQQNFLGVATIGDASIEAAKEAGGLKEVHSVNKDMFGILGLYAKSCIIVTGG